MVLVVLVGIGGAWYVGQSRAAAAARDVTVPALRRHPLVAWALVAIVAYVAFTRVPALESRQPLGTLLLLVLLAAGFAIIQREALRLVPAEAEPGQARRALHTLRARITDSVTGDATAATQPATAPATAAAPAPDLLQRLERLDDLHRRGVLDDDEFDAAKRMLLVEPGAERPRPVSRPARDGGSDGSRTP